LCVIVVPVTNTTWTVREWANGLTPVPALSWRETLDVVATWATEESWLHVVESVGNVGPQPILVVLERLWEYRNQVKVEGLTCHSSTIHGDGELVVRIWRRDVWCDGGVDLLEVDESWWDIWNGSARPGLVGSVGLEGHREGGVVHQISGVVVQHVERDVVGLRNDVESPPAIVLETDWTSGVEWNVYLKGGWKSVKRVEEIKCQADSVANGSPGSDDRGEWLDWVLRLGDQVSGEARHSICICSRALESSVRNHLGVDTTVSRVIDVLVHEAIKQWRGLVPVAGVVEADLEGDGRGIVDGVVDVRSV